MSEVFRLRGRSAPWGDYGDMLLHGMISGHTFWGDELLAVERVGPFVPPISFPFGEMLVTEALKSEIESAFPDIAFRPTIYGKVTKIDWRSWDLGAKEPERYPAGGEPENYIERRKHAPEIAAEMPALWAVDVVPRPGVQKEGTKALFHSQIPDINLFRTYSLLFASRRLAEFLQDRVGEWVECPPAEIVDAL